MRILVSSQYSGSDDVHEHESMRYRRRSHISVLRRRLSDCLLRGMGLSLQYVAFDEGPVYKVVRNPLRWRRLRKNIGLVRDTTLFRDRVFEWLDDVHDSEQTSDFMVESDI